MPALSMGCQMNNYMEWVSTYVKLEVLGMFINTLSSSNFDFGRLWSSGCDYPLEYLEYTQIYKIYRKYFALAQQVT